MDSTALVFELERRLADARATKEAAYRVYTESTSGMRESNKATWAKAAERMRDIEIALKVVREIAG
jgi:hypothetical protein